MLESLVFLKCNEDFSCRTEKGGKGREREGKRERREREGKRKGRGRTPHCFSDKSNPAPKQLDIVQKSLILAKD